MVTSDGMLGNNESVKRGEIFGIGVVVEESVLDSVGVHFF